MGYYAAGGNVAWSPPSFLPPASQPYTQTTAPLMPVASSSPDYGMEPPPRKRRTTIDLTALRRAERRIERATRIFSRLYRAKKQGHHGLLFKKKARRK
ncbi:MAG: hypothetical protein LLG45_13460 [Actinomycetia bacterium]|nr:hypothetical protein [Actinomycetes bacterium]